MTLRKQIDDNKAEVELEKQIIHYPRPESPSYRKKLLELESLRDARAEEKISIHQIKLKGELLGEGGFGKAYKLGDKVYKIYHSHVENTAKRSAGYWNKIYKEIYDGKYARYATAIHQKIDDEEVLITPYIQGRKFNSDCCCIPTAPLKRFTKAFKKIGLGMQDPDQEGNLLIVGEDPLPVDLDNVYRLPENYCFFFYKYSSYDPPSPTSLACAKVVHFFLRTDNAKKTKPITEINDTIGFRSIFMRA